MHSRPSLAILNEDHPKIKTITNPAETDLLLNYLITILNLKASTETEAKDLSIQMLVVMDFIKSKFGSLTIPEIQEAFKMYLAKEFPGIKVFRILDCVVVGEILSAYTEFRNESLKIYDQKRKAMENRPVEKSDEEVLEIMKNAVNRVYNNFKETKEIEEPLEYIFDHLLQIGRIKNSTTPKLAEYYQNKHNQATKEIEVELRSNSSSDNDLIRKQAKSDYEQFKSGNSSKVLIRAKKLVLVDFFLKQIQLENQAII